MLNKPLAQHLGKPCVDSSCSDVTIWLTFENSGSQEELRALAVGEGHTHTQIRKHMHTHTHTHSRTQIRKHMHTHTHTHTHTHAHTFTFTHTRTRTHTLTHTHTLKTQAAAMRWVPWRNLKPFTFDCRLSGRYRRSSNWLCWNESFASCTMFLQYVLL